MTRTQRLTRRLRAACRTNHPQVLSILLLTGISILALMSRKHGSPYWFDVAVVLFWPTLAFISNCIHPIPSPVGEDERGQSRHG